MRSLPMSYRNGGCVSTIPGGTESPEVETIYFGGGTPSHVAPGALGRILDVVRSDRAVAAAAEITIETNPDDVTEANAR